MDLVIRKLVMKVFSNRLIWLIDMLNRVGIISVCILIIFGLCYFYFGFINSLVWYRKGNWKVSCMILFKNIFYVSVKVGCDMCGVNN